MEAFQGYGDLPGPGGFYEQHLDDLESYLLATPSCDLDHCFSCDGGSHGMPVLKHMQQQYCTTESSFENDSNRLRSSSTVNFSSNGSSISQTDCLSDIDNSVYNVSALGWPCSVDIASDPEHKSTELHPPAQHVIPHVSQIVDTRETTDTGSLNPFLMECDLSKRAINIIQRKDLKEMLVICAKAVADNDLLTSEWLVSEIRCLVSVCGEPLQRLGAYMLEGLVARLASSGSSICKALRCEEPTNTELLSYMHLLYEVCPYFKFGYLSANGAIADAVKNENKIHIVDFQISQGSQWIALIQALAVRPGGPPQIRITGIDDSVSAHARGGGLEIVGQRLSRLADSCGVPFEFQGLAISCCDLESKHLKVQPGEALAVNFALSLHHVPDESVSVENHRDRVLSMVKNLSPKVVTLVEQESDTNAVPFFSRFIETLEYYLAVFESMDVALPREHKERIKVEQHCLARDIVNVIACEGPQRVERHELLGKWRQRFAMAGFSPSPLSPFVNNTIKRLLESYSGEYRLQERNGCLYLGWMNRDLVASCAWI